MIGIGDRSAVSAFGVALGLLVGCGGRQAIHPALDASIAGTGGAGGDPSGAGGILASGGAAPTTIGTDLRIDHFGYHVDETKLAVVTGQAQLGVDLRRVSDNAIVATFTSGALAVDQDSGDQYSVVDFSSFKRTGDYYFAVPSKQFRTYPFSISDGVDDIVGEVAVKSYYYQRCNHDKALPYASDALGGYKGLGGQWVDGACHAGDSNAGPGPGSPNDGNLDLHGGWHDAGDYQKTLWDRGVEHLLFAYELNPKVWTDGQLDIPESGNGAPDLLDEIRWELDFYVRMQRPDGHFLTSVKGNNPTVTSPPSKSDQHRVYFDSVPPSDSDWSGGGTTTFEATGNAVRALAHAAIVYAAANQSASAAQYKSGALKGWAWLIGKTPANTNERRIELAAAAAIYRLDPSVGAAATLVNGFPWSTWDGLLPWNVTPSESLLTVAAYNTLLNSTASQTVKTTIKTALGRIVDRTWEQKGAYGGMFGDATGAWDYAWGSNRRASLYGANLLTALRFGALGKHTEAQIRTQALAYLHYMLGLNPVNMVYLTNMAAYGGEHSSFQLYHSWFSYTGNDSDHGNAQYNGLPKSVTEPLYPYYVDDKQTSTYGPAPGLVPGGPNPDYDGTYVIVGKAHPATAYRDFSVGCVWNGSACAGASWEITEPDVNYQAAFVFLVSYVMTGAGT